MKRNFEIIGSCLGWFAVITQFILMFQNRQTDIPEMIIRFFSFFTILTNTLVAFYFTTVAFKLKSTPFKWLVSKGTLTAITAFILIVGLVYQIALRSVWQPTGLQLIVDELLHTIIPLYVLLYWYFKINKQDLHLKSILRWLLYPFIFIVAILTRGHLSGYYPYPFLDVNQIGMGQALINSALIFATILITMMMLFFMGKRITKTPIKA